jgi:hypothetical protein
MSVVNKKGIVIQTQPTKIVYTEFLKIVKDFKEVRCGVGGGDEPFEFAFLKVEKKEVIDVVRMNQMDVTYSIMYNSRMNEELNQNYHDILYIHELRGTLLDN